MKKKLLLIFDFDQTITSVDSFCKIAKKKKIKRRSINK